MVMIAAGRLDRRITIQTFTESQDATGEPVKTWANLGTVPTVWAEVLPVSGREAFASGQVIGSFDTRFRIRNRTDLNAEMRIVFESENYYIVSIAELGRNRGLEILAKKEQA